MHKAMMKAMRSVNAVQVPTQSGPPPIKNIPVEVIGKSEKTLRCPRWPARNYIATANLRNLSNGKEIQGCEFVIDTGCHGAIVIPAFVADQIGLDNSTLIDVPTMGTADGATVDAPTYKVILIINGIPIQTTAMVSGTAGEKALIGAELLSLFDLEIRGDSCRLSLAASK